MKKKLGVLLLLALVIAGLFLGACVSNPDENPHKGQVNKQLYAVGDYIELVALYENAPYQRVMITQAEKGVTVSFDGGEPQSFTHLPWVIINGIEVEPLEGGTVVWFSENDWATPQ